MTYYVTHGKFSSTGQPTPMAIDQGPPEKPFSLSRALEQACYVISEGKSNVTIKDSDGHKICGDDLMACCRNEKKLTSDLRAIPN